jgi:hypothetical protein
LYSEDQLRELSRQTREPHGQPAVRTATGGKGAVFRAARSPCSRTSAGVAAAAVVAAVVLFSQAGTPAPSKVVERFTRQCLAGDWDICEESLLDNDVQRMHFRRWCTLHFASLRDKFRPAGDEVDIAVAVIETSARRYVARVTMTSDFIGTRDHVQCWECHDGCWSFDVVASLPEGQRRG